MATAIRDDRFHLVLVLTRLGTGEARQPAINRDDSIVSFGHQHVPRVAIVLPQGAARNAVRVVQHNVTRDQSTQRAKQRCRHLHRS